MASAVPRFGLLETSVLERRNRKKAMVCSLLIELWAISIFFWIVQMQPHFPVVRETNLLITPLFLPPSSPPLRQPEQSTKAKPLLPHVPAKIEVPQIAMASKPPSEVPAPEFKLPKPPETKPAPAPPSPTPELAVVHPSEFRTGSSAKPTVKLPARQVQTGGFGDPKGFAGDAEGGSKGNVAKLGSFDLPSGPVRGNGSGGATGTPGVVASAGFGNGIAVSSRTSSGSGAVQSSGFGDASASGGGRKPEAPSETPDFVPAKIISKPKPIYPPEARELHLEGEVLLSVNFEASRRVQVLSVVRGLGHGMDEAAERAAEAIVFEPARRDGHPVDMQAVVHIIFQLAY